MIASKAENRGGERRDQLEPRSTADGSLTLWSERFGECFHSSAGARREAEQKFVQPAQLERCRSGAPVVVLDLCVGLGYNTAALLEAASSRGLQLQWLGLELDPRPLQLALGDAGFRGLWQGPTLAVLQQLSGSGQWHQPGLGQGRWWLGDARRQLPELVAEQRGRVDLILHDAFSPGHCPELWTVEVLTGLAALLKPQGRLLTYCAAAAVRRGLQLAGLELASIGAAAGVTERGSDTTWSLGTAASPTPFFAPGSAGSAAASAALLQPLSAMEQEHLLSRAAEPFRDPSGMADAATLQAERAARQRHHPGESTSAWSRRWGLSRQAAPDRGA